MNYNELQAVIERCVDLKLVDLAYELLESQKETQLNILDFKVAQQVELMQEKLHK